MIMYEILYGKYDQIFDLKNEESVLKCKDFQKNLKNEVKKKCEIRIRKDIKKKVDRKWKKEEKANKNRIKKEKNVERQTKKWETENQEMK